MSKPKPPTDLAEATRVWHEHMACMRGQTKIIADLRTTIDRLTNENETLRAAAAAETEQ